MSNGLSREISYAEVWTGDQFLKDEILEHPSESTQVRKDETFTVDQLREALMILQNSKDGKQQNLVGGILCLLFGGCDAPNTSSGGGSTSGSSSGSTGGSSSGSSGGSASGTTGGSAGGSASGTSNPITCTVLQALIGTCTLDGSINTGGGSFLNGSLDYATSFNISMISRTRRPTKFSLGKNCKNKPSKHSPEIDAEDIQG